MRGSGACSSSAADEEPRPHAAAVARVPVGRLLPDADGIGSGPVASDANGIEPPPSAYEVNGIEPGRGDRGQNGIESGPCVEAVSRIESVEKGDLKVGVIWRPSA